MENISARSQLEQAKSDLVAQEVALKEAISIFKRYENLIKEKALSKQEFEQQEAKVATIKANIKSIKAQILNSTHQLNKTELKAPASRQITKKSAIAGMLVSSEAFFNIAKDSVTELEVDADSSEIALLNPVMKAEIKIPNSQILLNGEIRLIYPELDSTTRLGKVRIKIDGNKTPAIGSYASAVINLPSRTVDFALPLSAISFESDGKTKVSMLDKNNKIYKKEVKLAKNSED